MIKAEHSRLADIIFRNYITRLLEKNFSGFYLTGDIPLLNSNENLIITPNHISWWDGFLIYYVLKKYIPGSIYLLMLERQLKKFWFFRKVGAFSINPNSINSISEAQKYFGEICKPENLIVLYPQGEIKQFDDRELGIKKGLNYFIKDLSNDSQILPAAFRIQYFEEKKPEIICRFGNVMTKKSITENFGNYTEEFENNIEILRNDSISRNFNINIFHS